MVKATEKLEKLFAERERIEAEIRALLVGDYLHTKEVAARFRVSVQAVHNWIVNGQLQTVGKHPDYGYLFRPEDVNAFTPPPKGNPRHREMREQRGN